MKQIPHLSVSGTQNLLVLFIFILVSGCGGGSASNTSRPSGNAAANPPAENLQPESFINSLEGIEFNLVGEEVVQLATGENYIDAGAIAISDTEGDISSAIILSGSVDSLVTNDYLLRYQLQDNAGNNAELVRIVRVSDGTLARQTRRAKGTTRANLGYLEHLPLNYGNTDISRAPLIIFNHGSGATGTNNLVSVECCGLPGVLQYGTWDDDLPFVILSPQRQIGINTPALNNFVEYALNTYDVDPTRVYMAGWSQGANATMQYAISHPEKLAAMVPTAGGLFSGIPGNICDSATVPMWLFLGNQDSSFINSTGTSSANAYDNCNPSSLARVTRFIDGDHFNTSIWPFLPLENNATDENGDQIDQSIFDWLLSHSR